MNKVDLIVIHGLPGSGKSTLANELSAKLNIVWFGKDHFKEIIVNGLALDHQLAKKSGAVATDFLYFTAERLITNQHKVILENYWHKNFATSKLNELIDKHGLQVVQILCRLDGQELLKRFQSRAGGDHDKIYGLATVEPQLLELITQGEIDFLDLHNCVNIEVNTSEPINFIVNKVLDKINILV